MFWKDASGALIGGIPALKSIVEQKNQTLVFAMNGGMFKPGYAPVGLYVQERKEIAPLDTSSGKGNFYLKPNGVFAITAQRRAFVIPTERFVNFGNVMYATQSGPMLVTDGEIHRKFKVGSSHLHIRNGVGILPDGRVLFAMSRTPVSLYDFALYFKNAGCRNALYLDGAISRAYLPHLGWRHIGGKLGVLIGITQSPTPASTTRNDTPRR